MRALVDMRKNAKEKELEALLSRTIPALAS
jgi:hypothetical protein